MGRSSLIILQLLNDFTSSSNSKEAHYDIFEVNDETLEFDEEVESLRSWSIINEDLSYIASQKLSEQDKISPIPKYKLEDESDNGVQTKIEKDSLKMSDSMNDKYS